MTEFLAVLLKIALVVFMAGNLLDMGLRLVPQDALRGSQNIRFVAYTLLFGFVLGPAVALAITRVIPLEPPYAVGLILMGISRCALLPANDWRLFSLMQPVRPRMSDNVWQLSDCVQVHPPLGTDNVDAEISVEITMNMIPSSGIRRGRGSAWGSIRSQQQCQ